MLRCDKVIEVMVMALCSSNILYDSSSDPIQEPFKVLMRFLDIFSRFDWINYAVSVTGLIVLPSSSVPSELRDEDTGTETDSPMYSSAPSPLSSTSCESEACTYPVVGSSNLSAKLSAIVDKYRVRMSLTSLSDDIDDQGPHRLHSVDTDVEDDSFCDERDKQKRGLRINTHKDQVAGFPRMRSDMEHIAPGGGLRGMHALLSESDIKMVSLSRTGLIVLDPTKGYSNLCTTNTTAVTPDTHLVHQECLKSMFASGLSTIRQSLDATDIALKDSCFEEVCSASGEADMMRGTNTSAAEVMKIVRQIFPAMSEMTALKESMMAFTSGAGIDGSVLPNLVQNSTVHLSSTLRYAENAISSKIKTAPTVINDQAGASYLRYKGNNHENETVTSAMMHPTLTKQSDNDVLGLSEISISKSFSSFESDIGLSNDYSISLSGDQSTDAARRFLSAYSPTDLTPSVSYDAYLSRPQNLGPGCVVHSDHIRSDSFSSTGVSYQRDSNQHFLQPGSKILSTSSLDHTKSPIVTGEVYHQHQKTLMRHTQNIPQIIPGHSQSAPCLVRPPVVAMPSRVGESQQETMSNVSAHQPIKAQVPPPVPTISGKLLSPPFIQPFVVKEMQVWVPGKFGSSNSSPATTKIPTQTPQVAKPVGYPKVAYPANGGHMSVGGQVQGQGQGQGQGGLAGILFTYLS